MKIWDVTKNIALKAKFSTKSESESSSENDEDVILLEKTLKSLMKKQGKYSKKLLPTCYNCQEVGHYKNKCPKEEKEKKYKKKKKHSKYPKMHAFNR